MIQSPIEFDHIAVIDPALRIPETDVFNLITTLSPLPCSYHLPGMADVASLEREIPDHVRAVIVLGGGASLVDPLEWRKKLESWFQKCLLKDVPVLAVAWGHQWIAHLFGGEVGPIPTSIKEKIKGFRDFEVENCSPFKAGKGRLAFSHRSMVLKAPSGTHCFVKSDFIPNEGFKYASHHIFTFQAHPEATEVYMRNNSYPEAYASEDLSFGHGLVKQFLDGLN